MPVEFSVGAYRFGHSQVRAAYRHRPGRALHPGVQPRRAKMTFEAVGVIGAAHVIFWPNFLDVDPDVDGGTPVNISRKIDTLLSSGLFTLPIPGAVAGGSAILAKRNIQRAREYGLPSGQAVATASRRSGVSPTSDIAAQIPRSGSAP